MSVRLDWQTEGTSQSKISKLDASTCCVYEQVLRFKIAMENSVLMQVDKGLQNLMEEGLCLFFGEWLVALLLHVLFQVKLKVLEHQEELIL